MAFRIHRLHVYTSDGKEVVRGVNLALKRPGVYVVMGPNGAGKSSLVNAVMGHRGYRVEGAVELDGEDLTRLPTHERARRGVTLAVQQPPGVEGVRVSELLARVAKRFRGAEGAEALRLVRHALRVVGLPDSMLSRHFMVGMSGGERKRLELARVLLQKPRVAMLDEPDSGVDVESMPAVARAIEELRREGSMVLLITHQPRLLGLVEPDEVYVMHGGRIVASGGPEIARLVEEKGYTWMAEHNGSRG